MSIRRPAPDAGVIAAVESCQSNTRMKRMVMFGLRALSELCTPPRGRYKENALDALSRGITPSLVDICKNMGDDEEVMELVMKVCWGVSQGLEEYNDTELAQRFEHEGGTIAAATSLNGIPSEPETVITAFGMLETLTRLGIALDAATIAPGMLKAIGNPSLGVIGSAKVAAAVVVVAQTPAGAETLWQHGAVGALVSFAGIQVQSTEAAAVSAACDALVAAGQISKAGGGDSSSVMVTRALIDKNKGRTKIVDAGCRALAGMLTLDQLSAALEALNAPVGSPERDNALEVLSAMSYVQEFAGAIVEAGSVPLLVQAVIATHDYLSPETRDDALMKGLIGTVVLLGRISRNASHASQVYEAGGLAAIAAAMSMVTDHPEAFSACCGAVAALAQCEEYAMELYSSYGMTGVVIATLYERSDNELIQDGCLEFLCVMTHYDALKNPMVEESCFEIISYSMQYAPDNFTTQMFALKSLDALASEVYTTASLYEYGGFQGIAQSLITNVAKEEIAVLAFRVIGALACIPDITNYVTDGMMVDAVLYTMLEHTSCTVILEGGKSILESIATAEDATRHVATLDSAISNFAGDTGAAFKALAAAAGLSRVQRLAPTFEQAQTAEKVLQRLKPLIERPEGLGTQSVCVGTETMTLHEKLIRAAMTTVEAVAVNGTGPLDPIVPLALQTLCTDKLKPMVHHDVNTPEVLFVSVNKLAETDRIRGKAAIEQAIASAVAALSLFSDNKSTCGVILSILNHLVSAQGGVGATYFVEQGGAKAVLSYLKKTPYNLKVQVNGLSIIAGVLRATQDTYIELLKSAGTVEIVQTAMRTHQKSIGLRDVVAPIIAHLIPQSELEEMAGRYIGELRDSFDTTDFKRGLVTLRMLNDILVCSGGVRAATKKDAMAQIIRAADVNKSESDLKGSAAQALSVLCGHRAACGGEYRQEIPNVLLKLVQDLSDVANEEGILHSLKAIGRILQGDPGAADPNLKRQIVKVVTKVLQDYPNHRTIVPAAAQALGVLAATDADASALISVPEVGSMVDQLANEISTTPKLEARETATEATADLLQLGNPVLADFVVGHQMVPALVNVLDEYPANGKIVLNSTKALDSLGRNKFVNLRKAWESQAEAPDMKKLCNNFRNCMQENLNDVDAVVSIANAFARFPQPGEASLLKEAGMFDMIRDVFATHPDSEAAERACAEVVATVAGSDMVQGYIQQLIAADAAGDTKTVDDALTNLNVMLLAPLDDPDTALANEEEVWDVLTRQLQDARDAGHVKRMREILITAQRLVEQGMINPDGYRGAWYFAQHMLPTCAEMTEQGGAPMQSKRLITAMMNCLSGAASNPNTLPLTQDLVPVDKVLEMLDLNQNDLGVATAITGLLYFMGMDSAGIKKLTGAKQDIVPLLSNVMRAHRGAARIAVPATGVLANCAKMTDQPPSQSFTSGDALRATNRATSGPAEGQGPLDSHALQVYTEAIQNPEIAPTLLKEGILEKCIRRSEVAVTTTTSVPDALLRMGPAETPEAVTQRNLRALANLMEAYAKSGYGTKVVEKGGLKRLMDMLDDFPDDPTIRTAAVDAIVALAQQPGVIDAEFYNNVLVPKLFGAVTAEALDSSDPAEQQKAVGRLFFGDPMVRRQHPVAVAFTRSEECYWGLAQENGVPSLRNCYAAIHLLEASPAPPEDETEEMTEIRRRRVQHIIQVSRTVAENEEDPELLKRIDALEKKTQPSEPVPAPALEGMQIDMTAPEFQQDTDPDDPNALTLKQVHDWLRERLDQGLSIDVNDSSVSGYDGKRYIGALQEPLLYERFLFVFTKMTDYNALRLAPEDFAGYQSQWGCKSWELWALYTQDIIPTLLEWGVHTLLFEYLNVQVHEITGKQQKEVPIGTPPSGTIAALASVRDPGGTTIAELPNVAEQCDRNISIAVEEARTCSDDHIIPRVSMVEHIAINRTIFAAPHIIETLLSAWDLYDKGSCTSLALRHIFRALRRIVCDNHTDIIIEKNMTQRLIDELRKDFDNPLLIDGFFLLGVLSVDNRLKTIIGEQGGVEESLTILANHMEDPPGEGVITNAQLALANLVVGHRKNCNTFYRHHGLQLNVRVLNDRGEHFDETNAASALLTNACFRREDIKAAYGTPEIGAPSALAYAISCYDGGTDPGALRCLSNMFKAISNMSLYTPNVDLFLESGLENAYYNLLAQSESLPDDVVKTGLFTLSNLTWENKTENMEKFGIIIPPLIEMASQGQRHDVMLLGSTMETLAFLCRLEANSVTFTEYGGIRLATNLIKNHGASSSYVLQHAVSCLGSAARYKQNAPYLIEEGKYEDRLLTLTNCHVNYGERLSHVVFSLPLADVLPLLKDIIEGAYFQDETTQQTQLEVSLVAVRVTRRVLMAGGAEAAGGFGAIGGTGTLVWYLESVAATEDPVPQLALEGLRTLVGALALGQGDDPETYISIDTFVDELGGEQEAKKKSGNWFGRKKADSEETLPPLERPTTPRGYEVIGLDAAGMTSVVSSILTLMQSEALQRSIRFSRCALGFLAYVAAEAVPGLDTVITDRGEAVGAMLRVMFEEIGSNRESLLLLVAIFANTGYRVSGDFGGAFGKDSLAFKTALELAKKAAGKEKDKIERERGKKLSNHFDDFLSAWKAVANGDDGTVCFRKFASYETDFCLTLWHRDPYPNGVHDLPIKEELRAGGRFKIIVDEKTRDSFFWRANQTLALLQWRIEKDKNVETEGKPILEFTSGVPVSKISCVTRGLGNEMLRKAAKKQRGITDDLCFTIQGPATEDFPNGFDFGIKCKTKAERDQFVAWILDWREACSI